MSTKGDTMVTEIGVCNAAPLFTLGLRSVTENGSYTFHVVDDVEGWTATHRPPVLLMDIRNGDDLESLVGLKHEHPRSVVITLVDETSPKAVAQAIVAGASGAISRYSSPSEVMFALNAGMHNSTVLPLTVVRELVSSQVTEVTEVELEREEVEWLQSLARSTTVARVGEEAGYSEREMYRRLKRMYHKMGVRGRTEALLKASRLGWIT